MKIHIPKPIYVALGILLVVGGWYGAKLLLSRHDAHTLSLVDAEIQTQKSQLVYIADITRQNGADESTTKIIVDCGSSYRQRFDTLLDSLSTTITPAELRELDGLFYKCGRFYAERKAIMAARLDREVDRYVALKELRRGIRPESTDITAELAAWQAIADAEQKWADYFNGLVTHQGTIITLLQNGKRTTSPEVMAILSDANASRQQMEILGIQIQAERDTLAKI